MKKYLLLALISTAAISTVFSQQNDRYAAAMEELIVEIDAIDNDANLQELSNRMQRIAGAEPGEWLPNYYLSYIAMQRAMKAMQENRTEDLQAHLQAAETHLNAASEIVGENSEIACLQGYVYMGNIWVDQMTNGPIFSPQAHAAFQKAIALDATNPRPHMLSGMLTLFTPTFFGGGAENAMPALEAAAALFEEESTTDRNTLPTWGAASNNWMLEKAQSDLADGQ